jgi:DNA-binding beta-propeller fold protein YncE
MRLVLRLAAVCLAAVCLAAAGLPGAALAQQSFTAFESGPVRPLALSPDGTRLFAVNIPDNRLEIFRVGSGGIAREASVPVGLEPVAVAARTNTEVWVVNHLSDSISIVDVGATPPRVVRTLIVGDEPRDVVFAGPASGGFRTRAFVTAAHRGHQRPNQADPPLVSPQLTTAGVGRADVWVFDATNLGATLEGTPLTRIVLFADTPRALAVSPDGATVYAAAFHSGNKTATVNEGAVCNDNTPNGVVGGPCTVNGVSFPGALPLPETNAFNQIRPEAGLVVRHDGTNWVDELGRNWNDAIRFTLPDRDVFRIDASASPPVESGSAFTGVGTILFDMAVNPASGVVYVTNTEARNEVRFEGPGFTPPAFVTTTVQGRLHEARISVLSGATTTPRNVNAHIDYGVRPAPAGTRDKSLATPLGIAVNAAGSELYVAGFGSGKIGIYPAASVENGAYTAGNFTGGVLVPVSGGGPSGIVVDEARNRLYVATRFDNGVSVVDRASQSETFHVTLHDREPAVVKNGRPVLYDANLSSSNGEASCASCHVFGDLDSLTWDLGNPHDATLDNQNPFRLGPLIGFVDFHGMKGPMTTQTLRGLANHGPMHWRGDRSGANDPGGSALDENAAFNRFIGAFEGLLGKESPLAPSTMQQFADFMLSVEPPPNPIRALDGTLNAQQQAGRNRYFGAATDGGLNCNGCHVLNPGQGFFGTDGLSSFEGEPQHFKIAHLRNAYQKVGMFGFPNMAPALASSTGFLGDQIRGSGFLHDGSIDTVARFLSAAVFGINATEEAQLEAFSHAFDTVFAPIVGQQVTLTSANAAVANPRVDLLIARAGTSWVRADHNNTPVPNERECELVVKGNVLTGPDAGARGWARQSGGAFLSDRNTSYTDAQLRALAGTPGQELTYTCFPPAFTAGATGQRAGIDRDEDTVLDGLDNCPAFPNAGQADGDADGAGTGCDNCGSKANASQSDLDADGAGDLCDNACGFGATTLGGVTPATAPAGSWIDLTATGVGPSVQVHIAGVPVPLYQQNGAFGAQVPASLAPGAYLVEVVNPEGCRSQEVVSVTVTTPGGGCGLTGIEALVGLAALRAARRLRA